MKFKLTPMRHVHSDALEFAKMISMMLGLLFICVSAIFHILYTQTIYPSFPRLVKSLQLGSSDAFDLWVTFVYFFCGGVVVVLISFLIAVLEHRYCGKHCPVELNGA